MISMSLSELAAILRSTFTTTTNPVFNGLSKDTRTLIPGNVYVAILGESLDGHHYVEEAYQKGAIAAIVSRKVDCPIPQIIVPDTIKALGEIALNWRHRFPIPLVGVTGSNGKTTLKDMIASILRAACAGNENQVLATEGNLNNTIGVPFMLARLNAEHRLGVIEMGMNSFGEIEALTQMTEPQVAVITNAAESHLQGVINVAGVAKAKGEIFSGLNPKGIAVLNKDDAHFEYWHDLIDTHKFITFGLQNVADVTATINPCTDLSKQNITLITPLGKIDVCLPLLGKHNVMNAIAAAATGIALNLDLKTIKKGLETVVAAPGRMNEIVFSNGARIIDDSYNANPFSTQAAIYALAKYKGKKILVLADMREMGNDAESLHTLTGKRAREAGVDILFTYGDLAENCTKSFGENATHFTDKTLIAKALLPYLEAGNTILVKGSHSMHMEEVVAELVKNPIHAQVH